MRISAEKILWVMLSMSVILMSIPAVAHEQSLGDQSNVAKQEPAAVVPDLADIIPLTTKLSGRLAALESKVAGVRDVSALERKYNRIKEDLKGPAGQLQRLKDSKGLRFNKLVELRRVLDDENESFEEISKPLSKAIRQLGAWRKEWLAEKARWDKWESSMLKEGAFDHLRSAFATANGTIDTALDLVLKQLEIMLTLQENAGNIQIKINAFAAELDGLIQGERQSILLDKSPPMFSSRYLSQFGGGVLLSAVQNALNEITWPDSRFFARQGWIVLLQGFLSLFVIIAIYRKRQALNDSKRWQFIAARPFSAGLFLGMMTTLLFYQYGVEAETWNLAIVIAIGVSFARLSGDLIETHWKGQFVYGLMIFLILTKTMHVVSLPLPLFRLYMVLIALAGIIFFLRWAGESRRNKDSRLYTWALRLGSFFFFVILIAELLGNEGVTEYILVSLIDSMAIVLPFMLFTYMIHGGLEWVFYRSALRKVKMLLSDTDTIIHRAAFFINVTIGGLILLPAILMVWGVYDSFEGAIKGLLALGFSLGSQQISVGLVIVSAGIICGSFLLSWIFQILLMDEVIVKSQVERGVRISIGRLAHYVLILAGFLLAISMLGFDITKLTIMLSALGIGIGFGLQGVVNNFVSGLILLFERPVRVGDSIEINGKWAEIKRIGLRSTIVQTFDQADLIIPNADLVNNQVTNWTLSNRQVRIIIPVGVAYGSDVPLVMEKLTESAEKNSMVLKSPAPQVLFLNFGESSLDFELRVWIKDADARIKVKSDLHQDIDRSFRETKIEIAFPQQDLHLRSVDESVSTKLVQPPE